MPNDKDGSGGGDTYNIGQGIGVGRNVTMKNVVVNQYQGQQKLDLPKLADELGTLRTQMKKEATTPEHDVAVGAIAAAESAAKKGDEKSVLDHLKGAGQWGLELGLKVGVPVAIEAIKRSLIA
jgi:hypothetical protein